MIEKKNILGKEYPRENYKIINNICFLWYNLKLNMIKKLFKQHHEDYFHVILFKFT
jgi:hypothetical protein